MAATSDMALRNFAAQDNKSFSIGMKPLSVVIKSQGNAETFEVMPKRSKDGCANIDLTEVYFLIMHFLTGGPCQRTCGQLWNELLEHQLLPRRYHGWYSRTGQHSGDENDDGISLPLNYLQLTERYRHVDKDHLVQLLKQLLLSRTSRSLSMKNIKFPNAAHVPTLMGTGSFSLLNDDGDDKRTPEKHLPNYMRWPHMKANQVHGLALREIGGGFLRHQRSPSIRVACHVIAKPSTLIQRIENMKKMRGHRNAVYCATYDRSGRYVVTGSDDRLVKIWSMETAFCLSSCRGHEGDITDLAVSFNNAVVASASNDFTIRVWRLPDGMPVSVLRGHTASVTAIVFCPRIGSLHQLLSSSDDGTCRIWDARGSHVNPRVFVPRPPENISGRTNAQQADTNLIPHQIFCCAFNSSGTVFATGSSDNLARVWNACKPGVEDSNNPNHEMDILFGHENDVNYVQFRMSLNDGTKEESASKFRNLWFSHDNIVTCSRDGSATIWTPKSRRSHGKTRWVRQYHLRVPPPPTPPQPPRGPRQRVIPTPRGVNMIVWSLDNRFVLAAIMDNRICVWNAADSSVVHTLTGHTASTYVLDVHPWNPRIAMSAGYDGKTIVWDIWEGKPIKIYDMSPYKLVDGKFSPDGTSIILSDEVGQLHILSTGQGECQKDAKYDQFFLGDYRPVIQDSFGNVLDQETQLMPYRRNMQDLLCDSGMIPYEEPYQSMYQRRRLGALGMEWKPSSLRLAAGPDFSLDPEYQLLPLADLDFFVEPIPEFADAMDWEPEIEIRSDDTDSEYNVTEGYSSGGEQGSLNSGDSYETEVSEEDSDIEEKDDSRRTTRKSYKNNVELLTSSGRRVKRKKSEEVERNQIKNRSKNGRVGRKPLKGKSSKSKTPRPRRAAARNALNLFSKITGTATDGEPDDVSESELSDTESSLQDSIIGSDELEESSDRERFRNLKGKAVAVDESVDQMNPITGNRKRLILKLPVRDSKVVTCQNENRNDEVIDNGASSSRAPQLEQDENGVHAELKSEWHYVDDDERILPKLNIERSQNGDIKWGGVKARSFKRRRVGGMNLVKENGRQIITGNPTDFLETDNHSVKDIKDEVQLVEGNASATERVDNADSSVHYVENEDDIVFSKNEDASIPLITRLRIKSRNIAGGGDGQSNNVKPLEVADHDIPKENELTLEDAAETELVGNSAVDASDLANLNGCSKRVYNVVYKRSKPSKNRENSEDDYVARDCNFDAVSSDIHSLQHLTANQVDEVDSDTPNSSIRSRKGTEQENDSDFRSNGFVRTQVPHDEWGSTSRTTVGLRSSRSRSRRTNYNFRDTSPVDRRKLNLVKGGSWLMLPAHEEGPRYIPQLGDEVAYLRQGHQEYLELSCLKEMGPWKMIKGNLRAVEFCRVIKLDYSTLAGSGDSCCKMTFQFVDPSSNVFEKSFKLTLPEVTGFPDFLVERSRYDAAVQRNWACRDKCRVWWKNEGDEDGDWWHGRIIGIDPKSPEFPDSPWERFTIWYSSDPKEKHKHSPWELFDIDDDSRWEQPSIDKDSRDKLLAAFTKLERSANKSQDMFAVQKLRQVSQKPNFVNRFAVPLSVDIIYARVKNCYYRSVQALQHDIEVMVSNAESYFAKSSELLSKLQRMSEFLHTCLSSS